MSMHPDRPAPTPVEAALSEAERRFDRSASTSTRWRTTYPGRVRQALAEWGLEVTGWFPGGVGEPVLQVVRRDGSEAVLKVSGDPHLRYQAATMAGAPSAYAHVLAIADDGHAHLTEQLGPDLWSATTDPVEQCDVIGSLLVRAWEAPAEVAYGLDQGKARQLAAHVDTLGARHGADHPRAMALARLLADALARDEQTEVVCHGDPHPGNVLRRGEGWAFVDPDGWRGERAYDLGVVLRDHCRVLAARERESAGAATEALRGCAGRLAALTGVDVERVWRWGFVERVTTGLSLTHLGYPEEGRGFLDTAELVARGE